jgi:hypothetical protein
MSLEDEEMFDVHIVPVRDAGPCHFESAKDYNQLSFLMLATTLICITLVWTSALTMCSSNYILHESKLDVLILSADILSIDLFSCVFVLAGFTASFVYVAVGSQQWQVLRAQMCWSCYAIGLSANTVSLVVCSLWQWYLGNFHARDLGFTLMEGVFSLRLLDVNQSPDAMHSLNLFSWPVLIMMWCLLNVEWTWQGNAKIVKILGHHGHYLVIVLALCGISLFTLFGMMHSQTNIFYANSTSMAYRVLEFNLGVHVHYLMHAEFVVVSDVMMVMRRCRLLIYFVFIATWWTEMGVTVQDSPPVCLRLYARSNCLRDHHAFLLRGCLLGATVISSVDSVQHVMVPLNDLLRLLVVVPSAIALCCPVFSATLLIFVQTFSQTLVYDNIACVTLVITVLLWLIAYLYSVQLLPVLVDWLAGTADCVYSRCKQAVVARTDRPAVAEEQLTLNA